MATLEKELQLSRHEVETLIEAINSTMEESKKIERDLISIQVKIIEIPTVLCSCKNRRVVFCFSFLFRLFEAVQKCCKSRSI